MEGLYFLFILIGMYIFGALSEHVAASKGYRGGFWWGFFLGVIGLLVVGLRGDNHAQSEPETGYPMESLTKPASAFVSQGHANNWLCQCGYRNSSRLNYCNHCKRGKPRRRMGEDSWVCACGARNFGHGSVCRACNQLRAKEAAGSHFGAGAAAGQMNAGESAAWVCENCGRKNTPDALFCGRCGSSREKAREIIACGNCGQSNDPDNTYCIFCGNPL